MVFEIALLALCCTQVSWISKDFSQFQVINSLFESFFEASTGGLDAFGVIFCAQFSTFGKLLLLIVLFADYFFGVLFPLFAQNQLLAKIQRVKFPKLDHDSSTGTMNWSQTFSIDCLLADLVPKLSISEPFSVEALLKEVLRISQYRSLFLTYASNQGVIFEAIQDVASIEEFGIDDKLTLIIQAFPKIQRQQWITLIRKRTRTISLEFLGNCLTIFLIFCLFIIIQLEEDLYCLKDERKSLYITIKYGQNLQSLFMGNNHDKYFGSDKRKIIILGLDDSGKTTFLRFVSKEKVDFNTEKTKNLNIEDVKIKDLNITFFDLAGGERQRVFWKQQYEGTQGIIYIIDAQSSKENQQKSLNQLDKVMKQFNTNIPLAIGLTKIDKLQIIEWSKVKMDLNKYFQQKYKDRKLIKVCQVDYKSKQSVKNLLSWLLNETKPI